jgi:hypothetical protein
MYIRNGNSICKISMYRKRSNRIAANRFDTPERNYGMRTQEELNQASSAKLQKWLMKDDSDKARIEAIMADREKQAEEDWAKCDPNADQFVGVYAFLTAYTDSNVIWRAAKVKLLHEQHPAFYEVGNINGRLIRYDGRLAGMSDEEVFILIVEKMYEVIHRVEQCWGNKGWTYQDAIEKLYQTSMDDSIIRQRAKSAKKKMKKDDLLDHPYEEVSSRGHISIRRLRKIKEEADDVIGELQEQTDSE